MIYIINLKSKFKVLKYNHAVVIVTLWMVTL